MSVAVLEQPAAAEATVTVRDDVAAGLSDAYVAAHPHGSPYHRRAWLDVIQAAFGHRTTYLVAETSGAIAGVLPLVFFKSALFGRFAVSMPFLNYGGVLADNSRVERVLLERAIEVTRRAGGSHLELRHTRQHFPELAAKRHKVAMDLRLEATVELQWAALDRKVRNQVRKAEKSNLTAESGGVELLPAFYEVFAHNMRDLGTPVYSSRFFREVLTTFPDQTRVFVVRAAGRPVAASLVLWNGQTIEVPWASALREFNPLCVNIFLYWQMVQFAVGRGFTTFDFGRSTPGEGTFVFKKQWGAEPRELVWEYWTAGGAPLPSLNPANPKFDLAIRTWQRLPLWLANTLGPAVVRNIP
jgi:FemAB-related protein (PEP-CTERM system-associated)